MIDPETDEVPEARRKVRAARLNPTGRFEPETRVGFDDGWDIDEDLPPLRTTVSEERARKVVTRNQSPDISFDRSLNPYRGCEHGCIYCFARPSHGYLGLSAGLDFETKLVAKTNAPEALRRELSRPSDVPKPIAIGTNTDPHQPIERDRGLMRACLEVLQEFRHPLTIATKGTLIERDLDILGEMGQAGLAAVGIGVTTLDAQLARHMEPRVPAPKRKLAAIRRLAEAGCPVRIMASPIVPGLTDPELEAILAAGAEAGATVASWIMLRLPFEVAPHFRDRVEATYPGRAGKIIARVREMHGGRDNASRWQHRLRGEGEYAKIIARRFDVARKRAGLASEIEPLRTDLFSVPTEPGGQLSLF